MAETVIHVENLGKLYRIGRAQQRNDTLRDALMNGLRAPWARLRWDGRGTAAARDTIWALRGVSFDVQRGEVVGIIGRNGAGKSTLLKILSQITEPTEGRAAIKGRVGSLLEVGTGFHPELTGRENVYLSGAILGMKKAEIDRRFEEIVAFAEIEKFMDTPVKRYSSGMHVRLAFAVAAHLEPEILLVDEVLSVGDAAFQRKCLGKMGSVAGEGRTVLFVSHNMAAVQELCARGILLEQGSVSLDATAAEAVAAYLRTLEQAASQDLSERTERRGRGLVRLTGVEILAEDDTPSTTLYTGRPARFVFHVSTIRPGIACRFAIYDHQGRPITHFNSDLQGAEDSRDPTLGKRLICDLDEMLLVPGRYRINVSIRSEDVLEDHVEAAMFFDVEQGNVHGRPGPGDARYGIVCLQHRWITPARN